MYIAIQCAKQFTDMLPGPKTIFCGCYMHYRYVTFSRIRSKAQTVVHNLCITLVVNQNIQAISQEFTINNNITSHQQLWNGISITVIVLYLLCVFGFNMVLLESYCVNEIMLHLEFCPSKPNGHLFIAWHAEFGLAT